MDILPELKCTLLNAENLFIYLDQKPISIDLLSEAQWQKLSTSQNPLKPLKKLRELAKAVETMAPDVLLLCEVGGLESLQNFNHYFLRDQYHCCLLEGNSDRGIDVGYMIKKSLPLQFDFLSNRHREIDYLYPHERQSLETGLPTGKTITSHRFSRDAVELRLFKKDRARPSLVFLLTHLKSPLDRDRIDPRGSERREAELKTLVQIYQELENEVDAGTPLVVAGDFNGNATRHQTDAEFKYLYDHTDLDDVLHLAEIPVTERHTFFNVKNSGKSEGRQIDFCFLSPAAASFLNKRKTGVQVYFDEWGMPIRKPLTLDEKLQLPSDHYPIFWTFENFPLRD